MPVKSAVTAMILNGKSVLKPKDFDTYENFEIAVSYIKELSGSGHIDLVYEKMESSTGLRRTDAILYRITDKGREQLNP